MSDYCCTCKPGFSGTLEELLGLSAKEAPPPPTVEYVDLDGLKPQDREIVETILGLVDGIVDGEIAIDTFSKRTGPEGGWVTVEFGRC